MDATEARTHHIRRLVEEAGGPVKFAEKVKGRWQPAQISQWTSEKNPKAIGRQIARELEALLGLPEALLDRPPTVAPGSQPERMDPRIVGKAAKAVTIFLKRRDPKAELDLEADEDAELFSAVYLLFANPANQDGDMMLGATIADLVAKREAVRDARRSGGSRGDADGRAVGKEAGKALPNSEAAADGGAKRGTSATKHKGRTRRSD